MKHGRVAMLGVLGHLVQQNYRFPGYIDLEGHKFADLPNGFAGLAAVPTLGLIQIVLSIGWWDLKGWKQVEGSTPGDFGILTLIIFLNYYFQLIKILSFLSYFIFKKLLK